jgi:hypothetical protein
MNLSQLSTARVVVIAASAGILLVAVLITGMLVGQRAVSPAESLASDSGDSRPTVATPLPRPHASPGSDSGSEPDSASDSDAPDKENFVEFRDEEAGFAMKHPEGWQRRDASDSQVRLVVTPNDRDSVMVRVTPLNLDQIEGEEITEEDVRKLHGQTEKIVRSSEDVKVLAGPEVVKIADTVGTYYLYTFEDQASGERGVHAHYFVFEPDRMITLVFQTIPPKRFTELADVFDVMAESFELIR